MRRVVAWLVLLGVLVLVGLVGFWAGRSALEPPVNPLVSGESGPVTYSVSEQSIGRSLRFSTVAEWERTPLGRAAAGGVVTSVGFSSGDVAEVGDVLFTVGLRPVVVAEGAVPAFRPLSVKAEGADVAQLQAMLADLGFSDAEPDGVFGSGTVGAVKEWQRSLGVDDDGVVALGDVVFVPKFPARVAATEALTVGASVNPGDVVLSLLADAPSFVIPLSPDQRNLVPISGEVKVSYPDGVWEATIASAQESSQQGLDLLNLVLEGTDGGPVCGEVCVDYVSLTEKTDFDAEVVVIPQTSGPVVPVAAISTGPDGSHSVRLSSGEAVPVTVVASDNALAVVDGVSAGDVVVLPFGSESGASAGSGNDGDTATTGS